MSRSTALPTAGSRAAGAPPVASAVNAFRRRILHWYAHNARDLPWRHTVDPYSIIVSEVMLQQTQVARVTPRFVEWLKAWPDLESLAAAPLADVLRRWQGLGYNTRAARLRACGAAAVAEVAPGGRASLPRSQQELMALPGVGPYTARAILIFAHNDDLAAVDTNVRRVLTHELGLAPGLSDEDLQVVAEAAVPRGRSRDWHNALMDYGALVLTTRATGIAPRTRQSPFEGSRRQQRARLLRALLEHSPRTVTELADHLALPATTVEALIELLHSDGLVTVDGNRVATA